jgi:phage tail sheath protein FI
MSTNLDGTNIVVPSSSIALRTLAYNDQVAFPWFAPAGFQRGIVSNATSTGYLDRATGEFKAVALNEGQRDSLYSNKVNPIANFPGRGINVFGQKTLSPTSSALDRVNVARLVVYIRERLDDLVKPFLFEPNDASTRADAKAIVDRFLANLVTQRGLFDFVTVCDTTNNTAERIDRNELHIDIAIQPIKAIEFIYIPIRVQNTLGSTA